MRITSDIPTNRMYALAAVLWAVERIIALILQALGLL